MAGVSPDGLVLRLAYLFQSAKPPLRTQTQDKELRLAYLFQSAKPLCVVVP